MGNWESPNPSTRSSLSGHNASHVPFTSVIDHQAFSVLLNYQRSDECRQLAWFEQIGGVPRPARGAACDHIQMGACEGLVHEQSAWLQHLGEPFEQRSIEKADADDRVERVGPERQRTHIRHDAEDSLVSSHGGRYRAMDEVHDDGGPFAPRDRFGMAAGPAGQVEDECVGWQSGAALDDPRRRGVVRLLFTLAVPRVPLAALAARIVSSAH